MPDPCRSAVGPASVGVTHAAWIMSHPGARPRSIGVGTDNLCIAPGPQCPPDVLGEATLDEPDAAVGQRRVDAAGVVARSIGVITVVGAAAGAIEPAGCPGVLVRVRGYDGVEERDSR